MDLIECIIEESLWVACGWYVHTVALDSQVRGLKTALVEADDFSAG